MCGCDLMLWNWPDLWYTGIWTYMDISNCSTALLAQIICKFSFTTEHFNVLLPDVYVCHSLLCIQSDVFLDHITNSSCWLTSFLINPDCPNKYCVVFADACRVSENGVDCWCDITSRMSANYWKTLRHISGSFQGNNNAGRQSVRALTCTHYAN